MFLALFVLLTCKQCWPAYKVAPKSSLLFMAASGMAAGLVWSFGYRALQLSSVN